ncbi:MAG: hypothetical protein KJ893_00445 [Candidatus Omnitrophica bacterium]|nr:hypothetical protein [Candidatus Omnitrophota bacterium]MBU4479333.1 hypothetical protein [Candidatus Omnitrophota bacterium]MCG2704227.1 hypothetical protein [Candidatus Omnitrophota bacterium]
MINLVFIHGINYQTTGYSNWLFQNILCQYGKILRQKGIAANEIEQKKAQFVQKEILWAYTLGAGFVHQTALICVYRANVFHERAVN